jgi:2-aminoethylphosphonate aminotransferase
MSNVKRNILLNLGPATTSDSVKLAQVVPDICPREEEFATLLEYITNELTKTVADPSSYTTVQFGGSGTSAVEAVISSVVPPDSSILIINNGSYGRRMCEITKVYALPLLEFNSPVNKQIDVSDLEQCLQGSPSNVSHLALVHHETSTGLLNDIQPIGDLCKKYNIDLIVDAMSSFAAIPISMKKMNISYLISSSNKNLQGMPGVSFVVAPITKLKELKSISPKNYYLNLYEQYHYFSQTSQFRFTPPVQTLYALKQAIIELKEEGIHERYTRYAKSWRTLLQGIKRLGLSLLIDEKYHSKLLTAINEPDCDNYNFKEMHDFFYKEGYTVYPGKINTFNTFRVANIGDINYQDIHCFLDFLEKYLQQIGFTGGEQSNP